MYGHYTGLNNHYYCSSVEEGCKCGLRGVCKENVEAIIANVIKTYALNATIQGVKNPITDFFKLDKREETRIKEDIKNNENLIQSLKERITKRKKDYNNAVELSVQYFKDKPRYEIYERIIKEADADVNNWEKDIISLMANNRNNEKKLKSEKNIKELIRRIQSTDNLDLLQELFKTAIHKINIFNSDSNNTILSISFTNGTCCDVIYSYKLLKNKYITLSLHDMLFYNAEKNCLESKDGYPLLISANGMIHNKDIQSDVKEQSILSGIPEKTLYQLILGDNYRIFEKEFSVDDYVRLIKNSTLPAYERLEKLTDEAKLQNVKYKEWRKKYNNGLPTCVPFAVRDANYEKICKERKQLYNRKYKIKQHKKLSIEEKEKLLNKIDERLQELSAYVKYLTRDEALKKAMKK